MDTSREYLTENEINRIIKEVKEAVQGKGLNNKRLSLSNFLKFHIEVLKKVQPSSKDKGILCLKSLHEKIILSSGSVIQLSKGVKYEIENTHLQIRDIPSMLILKRAILESFLTTEYLYYNNLSEEENEFRFNLYIHSGLKARQKHFENSNHPFLVQMQDEAREIRDLKKEIESSVFYNKIQKSNKWKFKKFGLARLDSWESLIEKSSLNTSLFSKQYTLSTNYAHSEYISTLQISQGDYRVSNKENEKIAELEMDILRMVNSLCIKNLFDNFQETEDIYKNVGSEIIFQVKAWSDIASGNYE